MAKILLIDDDDSVRRMIGLTLTHRGHAVTEAGNGREGLALLEQQDFDLLITDIVMPEIDGLEILIELRKRSPRIKMITISGGGILTAGEYLGMSHQLGAMKMLEKPFTNGAMVEAVEELLGIDSPPIEPSGLS